MYLLLLLLWFIFNGRVTLEVALFDSDLRLALLVYLQVHGLQLSEREGSCEKHSSLSEICLCFALGNFQGECGCHQDYFFAEKQRFSLHL